MTTPVHAPAPVVVVMGVSGAGKSTVAAALAEQLRTPWTDADSLHLDSNIAKMTAGVPLTDEDRKPWLDRVGRELAKAEASGGIVVACSALKRVYRDQLRASSPRAVFLHLTGSTELLRARAESREGHFMPAGLLASQLAALEPLDADESGAEFSTAQTLQQITDAALSWLDSRPSQVRRRKRMFHPN